MWVIPDRRISIFRDEGVERMKSENAGFVELQKSLDRNGVGNAWNRADERRGGAEWWVVGCCGRGGGGLVSSS